MERNKIKKIPLNIQKFASGNAANSVDIEFTADVERVQNSIRKLVSTIDTLKTKLQASNIAYGNNARSVEVLEQRNKLLNETLTAQKKLVKNLEEALKLQGNQSEENAKQKEKLTKQINKVNNSMILNEARMAKNNQKIEEQAEVTQDAETEWVNYATVFKVGIAAASAGIKSFSSQINLLRNAVNSINIESLLSEV